MKKDKLVFQEPYIKVPVVAVVFFVQLLVIVYSVGFGNGKNSK